jgi:hypothetical protein
MRATVRNIQEFMPPEYRVLYCCDGFSLSVNGSQYHFCRPRNNHGPWSHVEVGYPSLVSRELHLYAKDRNDPNTIYSEVPLPVVIELVNKHGGLDVKRTRYQVYGQENI